MSRFNETIYRHSEFLTVITLHLYVYMGDDTTIETIAKLLEGAAAEAENPEVRYRINSARQMIDVVEHHESLLNERVSTVVDDDVREQLRDLGYLN